MNQTLKRTLALLMIFCLMLGFVPIEGMRDLIPKAGADSGRDAVQNAEIPKAFSLPDSPLGDERSSGLWRYALRVSDACAVITGYDGAETELTVPQELDGIDVVGLASKALPQAKHVTLHTNIFYLAEDCFGKDLREITAPNGSLGLYWASTHDITYNTGKDYDLVPGVIDYTDALPGRVQKRGESHVVFHELEALPLTPGSLFFMRDTRGMEFFFRVLELTGQGDSVIAAVEIPEVSDALINYQTTVELALTADDFIPADGMTVTQAPADEKSVTTTRKSDETTISFGPFGAVRRSGKNDSIKSSCSITGEIVSRETIIYTVNVQNGEITATEYTEEQTKETSVTISAEAEENLLKEYGRAQEILKDAYEGKPVSEGDKKKVELLAGVSLDSGDNTGVGGLSGGAAYADIRKADEQIDRFIDAWVDCEDDKPAAGKWNCGEYKLQTPYFNVSVSVSLNISVSGSITYSNCHTTVTKNVYNFDTDQWDTVYTNGNASSGRDGQNVAVQIKGTVGLEIEAAVGAFFVKNFSMKIELGVEFGAAKKFGSGEALGFLNCSVFTVKPYLRLQVYVGVWVGKGTGLKYKVYDKEWTAQELLGREYLWQTHINLALNENKVHDPDECPLDSAKTVSYDTRTRLLLQSKTLFVGKPLTDSFNVNLNSLEEVQAADWPAGEFLGWAWKASDTTPTAAERDGSFKNEDGTEGDVFLDRNVTLYAVWQTQYTVSFDTGGGSAVPDQHVPSGGCIARPENPTKEQSVFTYWKTKDGTIWDFEQSTVTSDLTLYADWGAGSAQPGAGTTEAEYIGRYADVSEESRYDPKSVLDSGVIIPAAFLEYEVSYLDGVPNGIVITGVKRFPEKLIIPKTLPYGSDEEELRIVDIKRDAFQNCTTLKSVYFLTDEDQMLTTEEMFMGCANLEYAELPALENGMIGARMFSGCASLKCVKVRAGANAIGVSAFEGTGLTECVLPYGIERIGKYAFRGCASMELLYIPDSVTGIEREQGYYNGRYHDDGPFIGCTGMKWISIGGVGKIESGMLKTGSRELRRLVIRDSVSTIGTHAFDSTDGYVTGLNNFSGNGYACSGNAELVIQEGVTAIESYAFRACAIFGAVSLPMSLSVVGEGAFAGCDGIRELIIPAAQNVNNGAFSDCKNLQKLTLRQTKQIGDRAFSGCTSLKKLDLGQVESIGAYAFQNCTSLEKLEIPDKVKTIGVERVYHNGKWVSNGPFVGCTGLRTISVGGVETLESGMLKTGSPVLEQLTIRGTVKTIGGGALDSVNGYGDKDKANGYAFDGSAALELQNGVTAIEAYAFRACSIFGTVSLPASLSTIGEGAFLSCGGIRELIIPAAQNVNNGAFSDCENLQKLTLRQTKQIGDRAFSDCTSLKELDLGQVESIGKNAFENCAALETLYIPDTVRTIGINRTLINGDWSNSGPFAGCTGLRTISVGGVETIETGMLKTGSPVLEKLTIRGTVKTIGTAAFDSAKGYGDHDQANGYAFDGSAALEIQNGVETIEDYAFYGCDSFGTVTLPASLSAVKAFAFANCANLTDMLVRGTAMPFADEALRNNDSLTVHILSENDALAQYCAAQGIPYDTASAFPHTLTLRMSRTRGGDSIEQTLNWLDALELPVPEWDGHVFSGWYQDAACTVPWTGTEMPNRDLTLYAGWDIDIHTLTLELCGGTAAKTEYLVHAGDSVRVNTPTRAGYYFLGWGLNADGHSAFSGMMPSADTVLYALWRAESVNGQYRNDGDHMTLIGYEEIEEEGDTVWLPEQVDGLPVTAIAEGAFAFSGVRTLYIPAGVTEIEPGAFSQSYGLSQLNVAEDNGVYSSKNGVIYSKDGTALLFFPPAGRYSVYLSNDVQVIGEQAFDGTLLERVELPESVTEIGARAFRNTAITELTLPEGVETIGERAFTGCRDLALVEALGSPEDVDSTAFSGCNGFLLAYGPDEDCAFRRVMRNNGYLYNAFTLTMVQPTSTTTAFLQAGAEMLLPESPAVPENRAFTGWYLDKAFTEPLIDTTMPAHELTIYAGIVQVFDYTTITDEETQASRLTITACHALGDSVEIPESIDGVPVTKLASGTFSKQYRQVRIPASVTEIESGAFAEGTVLVCVPGSAADTWAQANGFETGVMTWTLRYETGFQLAPNPEELSGGSSLPLPEITRTGYTLSGWYWDEEHTEAVEQSAVMPQQDTVLYAGWTVSDESVAQMADALQWTLDSATDTIAITAYNGTATALDIPEKLHGKTVTAIEDYAFAYNPTLTEVKLPNTATVIGARAFFAMHALTEVTLPAALKAIPDDTFTDCIALAHISLPASLETIGANAFKNTSLTALSLPASLKSIHATALTDCAALSEITVAAGNRYYESRDGVLFDTADGVLVKYPVAKPNSSYAVENTWSVGAWAFDGAQNLAEITLSGDVWSLGEGAFAGCGKLTAMPELNSMITIIPDRCFYGCSSLSEAVIPDTVKKIGTLAFAGTALTELSIPQNVAQIGADAFGTDVILHGERESYAFTWAKENNRVFIPTGAAAIESIAIEQESLTMKRGERAALRVTVEPSDAELDFLTFYSSSAGIASVDEDGVIHAVGGGDAVIYATAPGGISASCRVTVEVDAETITLNAEAISLIVGKTQQLRESFTPLRVTDRSIVWTSSNEEAVTVDQKGLVTAVGDGVAVIRATAHNGLFSECKVSAYSHLTSFAIDGDSVVNAEVGGTVQLHPRFEPENLFSSEVRYTSSNETVVTINGSGVLSFQASGASIITAIPQADETKEVKILALCGLNSKLTLPAALSVIEEEAFAETAAQYVYIPSSVTRIGSKAFSDSEALWVAEFESGNAQIAGDAFDGCANLIVLAPVGSKAAAWATAKGIPVMALGSAS